MRLENKYKGSKYESLTEYFCDITRFLDEQAKVPNSRWRHYVYLGRHYSDKEKCLAVRIPGGTVDGIWLDDDNKIVKIEVDTNYVVRTYPDDINELLKKFIDEKIEMGD